MKAIPVTLALVAFSTMSLIPAVQAEPVQIGQALPGFTLPDLSGVEHSLADFKGKIVVLEFASQKCPWSRGADPALIRTATAYEEKGVVFLAIDSHYETPVEEIRPYAEKTGKTYPILKDAENKYADAVSAMRTPEIFIVDAQGVLVYHGAFDNRTRPEVEGEVNYVAKALDALLENKPIEQTEVAAWGCGIKRVPQEKPSDGK